MNGRTLSFDVAIVISAIHQLLHELSNIIASMGFYGAPYDLALNDYVAEFLIVLGGILQHHGAEAQCSFMVDSLLLRVGSITRAMSFGIWLLAWLRRTLFCCCTRLQITVCSLESFPRRWNMHCKVKYGEKYEDFAEATPYLLIPGVY
jgi:hypothetical protein